MNSSDFAGVIAITPDKGIILQVRDEKADIVDPGKLSIFAGRLRPGESPPQAAVRVFEEETTVKLRIDALEPLTTYQKELQRHGGQEKSHIFIAHGVDPSTVQIQQGQGFRVIYGPSDISEDNCALISYDILLEYFRAETMSR